MATTISAKCWACQKVHQVSYEAKTAAKNATEMRQAEALLQNKIQACDHIGGSRPLPPAEPDEKAVKVVGSWPTKKKKR